MKKYTKQQRKTIISGKALVLVLVAAIVSLMVNIFLSSLSWFDTTDYSNGPQLEYNQKIQYRSENCKFTTYEASNVDGEIIKGNVIGNGAYSTGNATTDSTTHKIIPAYRYFITDVYHGNINDGSQNFPTSISMFFSSINVGVNVGVAEPSNTYRTVSLANGATGSTISDFYLLRNAYVRERIETDTDDTVQLQIVWFIRNDSTTTDMSVTPANLYLTYS